MGRIVMKNGVRLMLGVVVMSYWVACAPKTFTKDPEVDKCQNFGEPCITEHGKDWFEYTARANGGLVDILIVNDNSGSMSFEQSHMAARFSTFLETLDSRFVDYRIGMITTDVSTAATQEKDPNNSSTWTRDNAPRAINQNGALQDGNLIKFQNGANFLSASEANREVLFSQALQRPETLQCENFLRQYPTTSPSAAGLIENCPSGDERGIFAANLFFDKNPSSFIRPSAHLAIVFLADEDVRSYLYQNPGYGLSEYDQPQTLMNKVTSSFTGKTLSVHSIIVKSPECLAAQSQQLGPGGSYGTTFNAVLGSYGYKYNDATRMTGGVSGNICATDYGSQLSNIGANIVDRIADIAIACENPGDFELSLDPPLSAITWTINGKNVHFSESLPPGTQVRLKYSCPSL